ncbi:hypothetical protein ACQ4LE_004879 [Meloidogyne hapla]
MNLIYFTIFLLSIFNLFELSESGNNCLGFGGSSGGSNVEKLTKVRNKMSKCIARYQSLINEANKTKISRKTLKKRDSIVERMNKLIDEAKNLGFTFPQEFENSQGTNQFSEFIRQLDEAIKRSQDPQHDVIPGLNVEENPPNFTQGQSSNTKPKVKKTRPVTNEIDEVDDENDK